MMIDTKMVRVRRYLESVYFVAACSPTHKISNETDCEADFYAVKVFLRVFTFIPVTQELLITSGIYQIKRSSNSRDLQMTLTSSNVFRRSKPTTTKKKSKYCPKIVIFYLTYITVCFVVNPLFRKKSSCNLIIVEDTF